MCHEPLNPDRECLQHPFAPSQSSFRPDNHSSDFYYHRSVLPVLEFHLFISLFLADLALCCCTLAFSSLGEWGLLAGCRALASYRGGFSCCRAWVLGLAGSVVVVHGPYFSTACGILVPRPRTELMSSALGGGFLTTGLPGKSLEFLCNHTLCTV